MLKPIKDKEEANNILNKFSLSDFFQEVDDEVLLQMISTNKIKDLCNALSLELHSGKSEKNEC
tara:strand:+ start:189 stop:377 length:189 start_codon:yes stop_codon:yes gene_type:complete